MVMWNFINAVAISLFFFFRTRTGGFSAFLQFLFFHKTRKMHYIQLWPEMELTELRMFAPYLWEVSKSFKNLYKCKNDSIGEPFPVLIWMHISFNRYLYQLIMHEALLGDGKTGTQGLGRSQDLQLPAVDRPTPPSQPFHNYKHMPGSPCGKENAS